MPNEEDLRESRHLEHADVDNSKQGLASQQENTDLARTSEPRSMGLYQLKQHIGLVPSTPPPTLTSTLRANQKRATSKSRRQIQQ